VASALAYRDFRLLWASSLCSWSSQWIQQAALGWVVYEITGSGALLGAVLGARAIPMFLLTPMSGVAADRWDRRRLMQASQGLASAVSLAFGVALALGAVSTWMLFAFTMLMGASNVLDRPARMTTAFELVPREVAMNAVALNTIGFSMMRIFGPAMAGYLIAAFGAAGSFFVQGVLYGASALVVVAVVFPGKAIKPGDSTAMSEMLEGLRFAARDRRTRLLVVLGALPFFLLVPVWGTLFPIYAKDVFGNRFEFNFDESLAPGEERIFSAGDLAMRTAHTLKGSSGNLGAAAMSRIRAKLRWTPASPSMCRLVTSQLLIPELRDALV